MPSIIGHVSLAVNATNELTDLNPISFQERVQTPFLPKRGGSEGPIPGRPSLPNAFSFTRPSPPEAGNGFFDALHGRVPFLGADLPNWE